jgi:hypothetical protein
LDSITGKGMDFYLRLLDKTDSETRLASDLLGPLRSFSMITGQVCEVASTLLFNMDARTLWVHVYSWHDS